MGRTLNLKQKSRLYSPWIFHAHCGGCNNCDIEVAAVLAPRFDIERIGAQLKNNPRHADIILVTGPVPKHSAPFLKRVYDQTPKPKVVMAVGGCAVDCGPYQRDDGKGNYALAGPTDKVIPVDVYVPGCPPKPETILHGVVLAVSKLAEKN